MADRRGTKRPTEEERIARLQKRGKPSDRGKGKAESSAAPAQSKPSQAAVVQALPRSTQSVPASRPAERIESRASRPEDRQASRADPRSERSDPRPDTRSARPREERLPPPPATRVRREDSSAHKALVTKFFTGLTVDVAESSRSSDPTKTSADCIAKLIEALCLAFAGHSAIRASSSRSEDDVNLARLIAQNAQDAEKEAKAARDAALEVAKSAEERARAAEERARKAEEGIRAAENSAVVAESARQGLETTLQQVQGELAAARAEHVRFLEVALPAALEDARAQAVEDFLGSEDFDSRLVAEYQEGMRDMQAGFRAANPTVVGVDWSFVPAESEEAVAEDAPEEGEVPGAARVAEGPEQIVLIPDDPEQPELAASSPPAAERVATQLVAGSSDQAS